MGDSTKLFENYSPHLSVWDHGPYLSVGYSKTELNEVPEMLAYMRHSFHFMFMLCPWHDEGENDIADKRKLVSENLQPMLKHF